MEGLADAFDMVTGDVTIPLGDSDTLVYPTLSETRLLKPVARITISARTEPFVASRFFRTDPGLCVYDSLANLFDLSTWQAASSTPARPYVASFLKTNADDKDIRLELPERHLSTLEDIAALMFNQRGGKSGFLLNNGRANTFYALGKNGEVCNVDVYWYSYNRKWDARRRRIVEYSKWDIRGWRLGEYDKWSAGNQVLCPGYVAL
ncbi:MAG: hypothetical protein WA082_02050 [Candidatus Moraniibacteriota bacterium]